MFRGSVSSSLTPISRYTHTAPSQLSPSPQMSFGSFEHRYELRRSPSTMSSGSAATAAVCATCPQNKNDPRATPVAPPHPHRTDATTAASPKTTAASLDTGALAAVIYETGCLRFYIVHCNTPD